MMSGQDHMRTHLSNLSRALLRLHKALLDSRRVSLEAGAWANRDEWRILSSSCSEMPGSPGLRPLSQLMVKIDELSEEEEVEDRAE